MNMTTLIGLLEEARVLREEYKARTMIYQVEEKEAAAKFFGRPLDYFYDLPYKRWSRIRSLYNSKI
jgi:hypothetical protein